jgi:hypothetical protein
VVSHLTTKEEYRVTINVGTEVVWIHNLMGELGFPFEELAVVYCDNKCAIHVVDNLVSHGKMEHVELHAHYLRQLV